MNSTEKMKTGENSQEYYENLARYLGGEMDEAGEADFTVFMKKNEEDMTMMEKMKEKWKALEGFREPSPHNAQKAWNKLHTRLLDENLIPAEPKEAKIRFATVMLRVAAVMVILAGIGAAFYYAFNQKPGIEMLVVNTVNEQNTLIKTLDDGSVVYLAQNTELSYPKEFETGGRNVTLSGEAFFDIAPDPGKPFTIETGEATIEVLGTAFNVRTGKGGNFEVIVDRGKVKVTLKSHPSVIEFVNAGEMVQAVNSHVIKSKSLNAGLPAWYTRKMQFKDETLHSILSVLNKNFNTTFVTANQEIGNRRLTVTFGGETPETITELICQALNLKSQAINGSIVFSDITGKPADSRP